MGCTTSLPSSSSSSSSSAVTASETDVVRKCKHHTLLIHNTMKYRRKFSASQSSYLRSLKNIGISLEEFSERVTTNTIIDAHHSSPKSYSNNGCISDSARTNFQCPTFRYSPPNTHPAEDENTKEYDSDERISPPEFSTPFSMHYGGGSTMDIFGTPRSNSFHDALSLDKEENSSPNFYSPLQDDLVPYGSMDSSWFSLDIFTPSHVPYHMREKERTMKWVVGMVQERKMYGKNYEDEVGMDDCSEEEEEEFMEIQRYNDDDDDDDDDEGMPELEEIEDMEDMEPHYVVEEDLCRKTNVESEEVERLHDQMQDESKSETIQELGIETNRIVAVVSKEDTVESNDGHGFEKNPIGMANKVVIPEMEEATMDEEKYAFAPLSPSHKRLNNEMVRFIREQFERAYKSGECVSGVLIPKVFYYHHQMGPSLASNAIASSHHSQTAYEEDDMTLSECDTVGNHMKTLQKLYAWERKLYDEVKEGELIRTMFDHTCRLLHDLTAKDANRMVLDKIKVTLKELDAQLLVALMAMQASSKKIENLTNEELYPQLCRLLEGLVDMWKIMSECHQAQEETTLEIDDAFEVSIEEPSKAQKDATLKLEYELLEWNDHLNNWLQYHKKYISDLYTWSQMHCQVNDENKDEVKKGKEDVCDWSRAHVFWLLKEWRDSLMSLDPYHKESMDNINKFASDVHLLYKIQSHDLKLKRREEKHAKKLNHKRTFSFRKLDISSASSSNGSSRWWEERSGIIGDHKINTLEVLKQHLPKIFKSMTSFAEASWRAYEKIQQQAQAQCV